MSIPAASVPAGPGVPPLNFAPGFQPGGPFTLVSARLAAFAVGQPTANYQQWGIFDQSLRAVIATGVNCDSCVGFEFRKDYTLADYPIEGGSFATYDKVSVPFLAKVRFAAGFSPQIRTNLLQAADLLSTSFQTFQVATPEFIYTSANVSHYDYRRESSRGVGLLVVDIWLTQVLQPAPLIMANGTTQNPSSSAQITLGLVNPVPVTTLQSNTLEFGSVS